MRTTIKNISCLALLLSAISCKEDNNRFCLYRSIKNHLEEHCISEHNNIHYFEIDDDKTIRRYKFRDNVLSNMVKFDSDGIKWYLRGDPKFPSDEEVCKINNYKAWVLLNRPF